MSVRKDALIFLASAVPSILAATILEEEKRRVWVRREPVERDAARLVLKRAAVRILNKVFGLADEVRWCWTRERLRAGAADPKEREGGVVALGSYNLAELNVYEDSVQDARGKVAS